MQTADSVREYLTFLADSRVQLLPDQPEQHRSYERLVLDHGRAFTPQPLPDDIPRGPKGNCYENSLHAALDSGGEYGYAEGWATSSIGLPIQHAWLVDADGNAYDPTWDHDAEYYGIAFDADWAWDRVVAQDVHGILANDWRADAALLVDGIPAEAYYDQG